MPKLKLRRRRPSSGDNPFSTVKRRSLLGRLFFRLGLWASKAYIRLNFVGLDNLPKEAPYILAANHQSYLDGLWIFAALNPEQRERTAAMIGSDLQAKHGLIGKMLMEGARAIPVNRYGNPIQGLLGAYSALETKNILLIHPEGTRTATGRLGELHAGAAHLAYKADVPLIPVYLDGPFRVFPRQAKWPRRDPKTHRRITVTIHFLKQLLPGQFQNKNELHAALVDTLEKQERIVLGL